MEIDAISLLVGLAIGAVFSCPLWNWSGKMVEKLI